VYDEMVAEARTLLGLGHHVVLDATWGSEQARRAARAVAEGTASELVELRCTAPAAVAAHRIEARGPAGASSSEATPAVAVALADRFAAWPEATVLDTTRPLGASVREALTSLGWPTVPSTVGA
jgi:predicted kinase